MRTASAAACSKGRGRLAKEISRCSARSLRARSEPRGSPRFLDGKARRNGLDTDLDGDQNLDVLVANAGGNVSLLLGKGDGTFNTAMNIAAGSQLGLAVAADVQAN